MKNRFQWHIEEITHFPGRSRFKSVLFDFDGTLSLIRQGWQDGMKPYFFDVLKETPGAEDGEAVMRCVHDFVDLLTGKQTIYQLQTHNLHGGELLGFGDGYVEIENVKEAGGFAVGVASHEEHRCGMDAWKRERLIRAGADIISTARNSS